MRTLRLSAAIGFAIGLTATATAQTPSAQKLPPVELGVGIDATWLRAGLFLDEAVVSEPMVHVRVTRPITPNLAIEAIVAASRWFNSNVFDYRTEVLYAIQIKQRVWNAANRDLFATYGAAGSWTRVLTHDSLHPPAYLIVGGGFQQQFAQRAALRIEMQGVLFAGFAPMGTRLSTSVSFW
jgi:hypothetical protein